MRYSKLIATFQLLCSLCFSQTINISGTVTDTAGSPISGAAVCLEQAGLATNTGADGTFALVDSSVDIEKNSQLIPHKFSAVVRNGRLILTATEKSTVKIAAFSLRGETVFEERKRVEAGTRSLSLPRLGAGVYLFRIQSGTSELYIKSPSIVGGSLGSSGPFSGSPSTASAGHAMIHDSISDVIAATMIGYLNYRMIATNSDTSGMEIVMLPSAGAVKDIEGNEYQTVKIGNQIWMAENYRCAKFNDGTPIPLVADSATWNTITTQAYCYYNNTTSADSIIKFGALYNWHVVDTNNTKDFAPPEWHVPTLDEWLELEEYLIANGYNWDGTTSRNKIGKAMAAKADWFLSGGEGDVGNDMPSNNSCGFYALPAGNRDGGGGYESIGESCSWWSATEDAAPSAFGFGLFYKDDDLDGGYSIKENGCSVRLVKD